MTNPVSYIPFQRVKDWKVGDRIGVDGLPGKVYDIVQFDDPNRTDMKNRIYWGDIRQ